MNKQQQEIMDEFINRRAGKPHGASSYNINGVEFTLEEFTQRAKVLGWINGYQFGKEYQTNGKKPDLDDDVLIQGEYDNIEIDDAKPVKAEDAAWILISKFRICDPRYKPKQPEESAVFSFARSGGMGDATGRFHDGCGISASKPDNSWHERGEWPPEFESCEVRYAMLTEWQKCFILSGTEMAVLDADGKWFISSISDKNQFRPIKSEREMFVDAADTIMRDAYAECTGSVKNKGHFNIEASALFDSGNFFYRPK